MSQIVSQKNTWDPYALWQKDQVKITWEYSNKDYDYHNQPYYRIAIPKDWDISKKEKEIIFEFLLIKIK